MEGEAGDLDFILGMIFMLALAVALACAIYIIAWAGSAAQAWVQKQLRKRRGK